MAEEISYLDAINRTASTVGLEARDKDEAFRAVAARLAESGAVTSPDQFVADLYAREAEGPTGIGGGIAIPHGKSEAVARTCITPVKLAHPLPWEGADDTPVSVLLVFAVRAEDSTDLHLRLLAQVARKLAHEDVCARLVAAESVDEMIAALS